MIKLIGLLSPIIVPLILSGLLFLSSERENRSKLYLAGYMLVISYVFLANAFYFQHNYHVYTWLHSLHIATVLMIYPGAYVYVKLLTSPDVRFSRLFIHFILAIFFFFASALIFFPFLSQEERVVFLAEYRFNPDFSKFWMKILYYVRMSNIVVLFLQVIVYLYLTVHELSKHRKLVADIFSNPERFQLNWLRYFNLALALSAFVSVFLYAVNPAKLFGDERYLAYPLLLIALILWFLGIMGNNQAMITELEKTEDEGPGPKKVDEPELARKLTKYFEEEKPYLNSDLKIWDVCSYMGTNRTYISNFINQHYGQNFSSFVNTYRLKEVKLQLEKNPEIPLKIISEEVGFGSVSSLSRAFLNHYKRSISDYKNTIS
jgi:AraC-like DNA-binding protein